MLASTVVVSRPDGAAGEVGEASAGFAHDHRERRDVEDVDVRLDHHIQRAAREQVVMHEIAVAAQCG